METLVLWQPGVLYCHYTPHKTVSKTKQNTHTSRLNPSQQLKWCLRSLSPVLSQCLGPIFPWRCLSFLQFQANDCPVTLDLSCIQEKLSLYRLSGFFLLLRCWLHFSTFQMETGSSLCGFISSLELIIKNQQVSGSFKATINR